MYVTVIAIPSGQIRLQQIYYMFTHIQLVCQRAVYAKEQYIIAYVLLKPTHTQANMYCQML